MPLSPVRARERERTMAVRRRQSDESAERACGVNTADERTLPHNHLLLLDLYLGHAVDKGAALLRIVEVVAEDGDRRHLVVRADRWLQVGCARTGERME